MSEAKGQGSHPADEELFVLRLPEQEAAQLKRALDSGEKLGNRFILQLGGHPEVVVNGKPLDAKVWNTRPRNKNSQVPERVRTLPLMCARLFCCCGLPRSINLPSC